MVREMIRRRDKTGALDVGKIKKDTSELCFDKKLKQLTLKQTGDRQIIGTISKAKTDILKRKIWKLKDVEEVIELNHFRAIIIDVNFKDGWRAAHTGQAQNQFCHIILLSDSKFALCHISKEQCQYSNVFLCSSLKRLVYGDSSDTEEYANDELFSGLQEREFSEIDQLYCTPTASPQADDENVPDHSNTTTTEPEDNTVDAATEPVTENLQV